MPLGKFTKEVCIRIIVNLTFAAKLISVAAANLTLTIGKSLLIKDYWQQLSGNAADSISTQLSLMFSLSCFLLLYRFIAKPLFLHKFGFCLSYSDICSTRKRKAWQQIPHCLYRTQV